jgi:hypothetical protein
MTLPMDSLLNRRAAARGGSPQADIFSLAGAEF